MSGAPPVAFAPTPWTGYPPPNRIASHLGPGLVRIGGVFRAGPFCISLPRRANKGHLISRHAPTVRKLPRDRRHKFCPPYHAQKRPLLWRTNAPLEGTCVKKGCSSAITAARTCWRTYKPAKPGLTQADESARETGLSRFCDTPETKKASISSRITKKGTVPARGLARTVPFWLRAQRPAVIAKLHPKER